MRGISDKDFRAWADGISEFIEHRLPVFYKERIEKLEKEISRRKKDLRMYKRLLKKHEPPKSP